MTTPATSQPTAPTDRRPLLWVLVAASAITAVSLGVRSTFGLFLTPVTEALSTDRAGFALAIAIQNLVWGLGQPVAGAIADRFGAPRVLAVGGGLYALGVLGMSRASTTTELYLSGGLLVGVAMAAASFSVVLAAVGRIAPPERRTWAMGIATAAGSLGQFILVPLAGQLEDAFGWRSALAALGSVALVAIALAPVLRLRTPAAGTAAAAEAAAAEPLGMALRRALRHPSYVLLCAGFFVCGFHVTFIGTHLPAYLGDVGLSKATGARAVALIGLFNIAGAFAAGSLAARFPKQRLLSLIYGLRAVAIVGLVLLPHTTATALAFGAVMGVLWLSTVPLTSGIVVGQFGVANAGSLFGIVFLAHQIGAFIGVWYGGKLADSTGSYVAVWWIAVGLGVFAAVIHFFIDDRPAPPAPVRVAGAGLGASAGMASIAVLAAVSAVGAANTTAARPTEQAAASATVPVCIVHPTG
ncbi:MAG: MFS transporter [Acidimicrobiia bacterium]